MCGELCGVSVVAECVSHYARVNVHVCVVSCCSIVLQSTKETKSKLVVKTLVATSPRHTATPPRIQFTWHSLLLDLLLLESLLL